MAAWLASLAQLEMRRRFDDDEDEFEDGFTLDDEDDEDLDDENEGPEDEEGLEFEELPDELDLDEDEE